MSEYFIPILFLLIFVYGAIKKVKPYDAFTEGAKSALPFAASVFPFLVSIFALTELFEISGLSAMLTKLLSPVFGIFGIPDELTPLVLVKPFSGSGSLALLSEIFTEYGGDIKHKLLTPVIISLAASFASCVFACFICRIM